MAKIKPSFSGHDKFDCKIDWIVKGLIAFNNDNTILLPSNIEKGISTLGLGINMIKSLNHWMKAFGLINDNKLTKLGIKILEKDPYLENDSTLWILHWNLVKSINNTTLYNIFFNKIYPYKFTKVELANKINSWLEVNSIKSSENTINSDIDVFFRMYSSSNDDISMSLLSGLNILTKNKNNYTLNINSTVKISDEVFIYILNDYIQQKSIKETISVDDLQRGTLSIQKCLCMSENSLFLKVNNLSKITDGKFNYSEALGMRQIYISGQLDSSKLLDNIFK